MAAEVSIERLEPRVLLSNAPPVVTGLTFTVDKYELGYAVGHLTGPISDDHAAAGTFDLSLSIDGGAYSLSTFATSDATEIYDDQIQLSYGDHEADVQLTETEQDSGDVIAGDPATIPFTVAPPPNDPPTLGNLSYQQIDDGTGYGKIGYITGDITDETRQFSEYELQFDYDGDGQMDDSATVEGDWTGFAVQYTPPPGSYSATVQLTEHDLNSGDSLAGGSASVSFTIARPDGPPVMQLTRFTPYPDNGYGSTGGNLEVSANDDGGGPYRLLIDSDGDGQADNTVDTDGDGQPDQVGYDLGGVSNFNGGIPIGATQVQIVDLASGQSTGWVAANFENKPPLIEKVAPIRIGYDKLAAGVPLGQVHAYDPGDTLIYTMLPAAPLQTTVIGMPISISLPPAISIDQQGNMTISDPLPIMTYYYTQGFQYTCYVAVRDRPQNGNVSYQTVTLNDDWRLYRDLAKQWINKWKDDTDRYITTTYVNATDAKNQLQDFVKDDIKSFTGDVTDIADLAFAGAAFGAADPLVAAIDVSAAAVKIITNAVAEKGAEGTDAVFQAITTSFNQLQDQEQDKASSTWNTEMTNYNSYVRDMDDSTAPDNEKARQMYTYLASLKLRLPDVAAMTPPATNDIYGEMLIAFGGKKNTPLRGSEMLQRDTGHFWDTNEAFNNEVTNELNRIGYKKGKVYNSPGQ